MPRISKLALVGSVLRFLGLIAVCFCGLLVWSLAQTLICFIGILAFPVLNATMPGVQAGAAGSERERCRSALPGHGGSSLPVALLPLLVLNLNLALVLAPDQPQPFTSDC